ncbi:MAG TPA: helix-turn-helix domain-containing protein [Pseudonocardiaceae bacterium]
MTRNVRTYDHFCLIARTLEQVGERWSLLVIRDLLSGPKRFTDLMKRLAGITPKTLTQRLRELLDAGLIAEDREPGRREVWYQLTDAGRELESITDALSWWGLRNAWRWPRPGEPLHIEHLLRAVAQAIDKTEGDHEPARWHFGFPDEDYLIECDGDRWLLTTTDSAVAADVTVTATVDTFVQLIFGPPGAPEPDLGIVGRPEAVRRFRRLITALADIVGRP